MKRAIAFGVMAKAPVPGEAKTRLARAFGSSWAAELARAMTEDTLARLEQHGAPVRGMVFAAPSPTVDAKSELRALAGDAWSITDQLGADLGARLVHAFATLFDRGASRALIVGSDAPHFPVEAIADAMSSDAEIILGPTDDGGYWLIGLSAPEPQLFTEVPWSTSSVAEVTRLRAAELGRSVALVAPTFDIDEAEDVSRLATLVRARPELAPLTARYLAEKYFATSGP